MYISNGNVFDSKYICIGKDCKEISYPVLWADEKKKEMCIYVIKNGTVERDDWGNPKTKVIKNIEFKIVSKEDYSEIGIKKKFVNKIKQEI